MLDKTQIYTAKRHTVDCLFYSEYHFMFCFSRFTKHNLSTYNFGHLYVISVHSRFLFTCTRQCKIHNIHERWDL